MINSNTQNQSARWELLRFVKAKQKLSLVSCVRLRYRRISSQKINSKTTEEKLRTKEIKSPSIRIAFFQFNQSNINSINTTTPSFLRKIVFVKVVKVPLQKDYQLQTHLLTIFCHWSQQKRTIHHLFLSRT